MPFNLDFAKNTILSFSCLFFLIIDLYFLIPAVIAEIFNPIALEIPSIEAKTEIEIHLGAAEAKMFNII